MHISSTHLLLEQNNCSLLSQTIPTICYGARCWQSFMIVCDDEIGDECDCLEPLFIFDIQMMDLVIVCDGWMWRLNMVASSCFLHNFDSLLHKSVLNSLDLLALVLAVAEQ